MLCHAQWYPTDPSEDINPVSFIGVNHTQSHNLNIILSHNLYCHNFLAYFSLVLIHQTVQRMRYVYMEFLMLAYIGLHL